MKKRKIVLAAGSTLLVTPLLVVGIAALFNGRTGAVTNYAESGMLAHKPPALAEPMTLKVVTFNIADAYLFTTNRPERMRALAEKLTELGVDIAGIQESFVAEDRHLLFDALASSRLKYHMIYPAATVGNGLLILSAWPIEEAYFHRYSTSNPWYRIWEGDWWAGKGVGLARIVLPNGSCIDFYDTHAQAGRANATGYLEVRTQQMTEMARFINDSRTGTGPAFVVGDFNTLLERDDLKTAIAEARLQRVMSIPSRIDHIFAVQDPKYEFETLETKEIFGDVQGSAADIFLSRAPSPAELWRMKYGKPETTHLSDHPGYISTIRVSPRP